ncbi:Coatomer, beta subunit [Basidiobolus meristosporus CBS 931.73]|uniref:Coatomer subunit beta n=1 Tax=Basidiobolus meristosporus CBS 931.73 TaxID=1314790 RepID=A0A1Y1Y3X9_9FUNG|nr:Coatomer, beta subunit [Basidiobolus meristosporus CBS 931.73]|eukprot:ORX92698.1 Coatomer, beta subunit [Basidiobolus meristosporus CBS 931.73]
MVAAEPCYTVICTDDTSDQLSIQEFKSAFEKGSDEVKIETMRKLLITMLNGDPCNQLLMHVIRFVMPSKNKALKKLLHFYWEICPKTNADGKLKQEMLLVCNALRSDLQHPNEYIRGATLRIVSKLREPELLEPLLPCCRSCLEHRHSYVRKNAVFAIYSIYKYCDYLIPDAPELIQTFLIAEADMTCKRNAFVMLCNTQQSRAVDYLKQVYNQIQGFDEPLQLAIIELIRKDCRNNTTEKGRYIKCIFDLLNASSHTVKYEAATTLMALTHNPVAVKAVASCYIELIAKEADNNIKLIVLDRLDDLRKKHDRMLDDLVMDILRVMTSPDIDVRRKALTIALEMVSARNVVEVVSFLKKELLKTQDQDYEKNTEYRQLMIQAIHTCAIRFSEVASDVVHVLMEFLYDANNSAAVDVLAFVREVIEKIPALRTSITGKLLEIFLDMKSSKAIRGALWIIGEYSDDSIAIQEAWKQIREGLGELPILASEQSMLEQAQKEEESSETTYDSKQPTASSSRRILADGTYASESALTADSKTSSQIEAIKAADKPPLRAQILGGDFFLGAVLSSTLTKLVYKYFDLCDDEKKRNILRAEAMLIMTGIIRVGQSQFPPAPIDEDSYDRIMSCIKSLAGLPADKVMKNIFTVDCKAAFTNMVQVQEQKNALKKSENKKATKIQVDDAITFRQFSKKNAADEADEFELDLTRATGEGYGRDSLMSQLNHVVQLTGFSDPVYAEAYVTVNQYDVLLDVLVINQTSETLQNLTIEFSTLGDLRLVEKPGQYTVGPHSFHSIKANIKVSSTETGVIFGNIIYDGPGASGSHCIILNDIRIDIMDYINPATCTEAQFRNMWTEFEWENKVNLSTTAGDLKAFLDHILKSTNMACLTPDSVLSGECGFLSANLYAKSIFGEDAIANLSIEQHKEGQITGHIRIRSKTQGIALSLGDKIAMSK